MQVMGLTSGVQGIATGEVFCAAIKLGDVHGWGYDGQGQLGDNNTLFIGPEGCPPV